MLLPYVHHLLDYSSSISHQRFPNRHSEPQRSGAGAILFIIGLWHKDVQHGAGIVRKHSLDAGILRAVRCGAVRTARGLSECPDGVTENSMSASALRKKSDTSLVRRVPFARASQLACPWHQTHGAARHAAQCADFGKVRFPSSIYSILVGS